MRFQAVYKFMNGFCIVHVLYHHVHILKFMDVVFDARAMAQSHHLVSCALLFSSITPNWAFNFSQKSSKFKGVCPAEVILANHCAADPFKHAAAIFIAAAESWFLWSNPAADKYHLNYVIHILVSSIFPENLGGSGSFALKDVRVVAILMWM